MPPRKTTSPPRESLSSLKKAVKVLSLFDLHQPELSLGEVVFQSGLPKTTAYRILSTLVESHICDKDPVTGRYSLGLMLLHFGHVRRRQTRLRDVAIPIIRWIRTHLDETVAISIRAGDDRVQLEQAEAHHPLFLHSEPGMHVPLYIGATGLILLAGLTPAQIESYIARTPLERKQRNQILTAAQLRAELARIAERGYCESRCELDHAKSMALAVPIRDEDGTTIGAVCTLVVESRYNPEFRNRALTFLTDGAQKIAAKFVRQ